MTINYYEEFEKLGLEYFNNKIDQYRKDGYFIPNSWKFHEQMFGDLKGSSCISDEEISQSKIEEKILSSIFDDSDYQVSDGFDNSVQISPKIKEWGYKYFPKM